MRGRVHHFDPTRLRATSKFIDYEYAPKTALVPATTALRKPLPGRLWQDKACVHRIKRISEREIHFAEIVARTIEHPLLAQEMVLFDEKRIYLDTSIELEYRKKPFLPAIAQRCSEAITASRDDPVDEQFRDDVVFISHHEGGGTWGHYLVQSIPRMLLFLDAFPSGKIAVPRWQLEGVTGCGYREALGFYNIPTERLAPIEESTVYPLKQAILLDFLFNFEFGAPHPKVLPLLRSFALSHAAPPSANRAAFIKRRAYALRAIANEQAVDEMMARHGIDVYGPDEIPFRAQIDLWQNCNLVIATLGSDLTNMVYARRGTRVLALSPHWFGDSFFFELSVAGSVGWYELRCGEMVARDNGAERFSSFNVDIDLLDSALSWLLA